MGAGPLGLDTLLANLRTAETPVASTVHEPLGKPGGPGLFHVKGLQLPAYVQHVAHHLIAQGHSESKAIQMAIGIVKNWAAGHDGHGNRVHADVQAAAVEAVAQWEAAKAAAHGRGTVMTAEARAGRAPYGNVTYADPGYQADKQKRYPLDTDEHIHAAWSYINKKANAAKYSPAQLASIKSKIRAAMKRIGAQVSDDSNGGGRSVPMHPVERRYTASTVGIVL